jgi:renalase
MRVVVVGAGLAGLFAARTAVDAGHEVIVLDKGRSPGGRMATRRIDTAEGTARLDHGAQFFTVRDDRFRRVVDTWVASNLVHEWCRGFDLEADGHPRYVGSGGMNSLAKHLAADLDVRCSTLVFSLQAGTNPRSWRVGLDDGTGLDADAVVITTPIPQALALTLPAGIDLPEDLMTIEYNRTLGVLLALDRPPGVPEPGGRNAPDAHIGFVADNVAKGISEIPALTLHASATWSLEHWDDAPEDTEAALHELARPWLGDAQIVESQLKRWRFATPQRLWPDPCWSARDVDAPLILAGDAFAGPRVEGAVLSGLAAGDVLARMN